MKTRFAAPKVFVSYAWESRNHKRWVKELAMRLRLDGVELILDQWELRPGDQLPEFMEKSVRNSDALLIVCTPSYKQKSDDRSGGVGYEGSVITAEVLGGAARRKFIPLLRRGEWNDASPSWLLGSVYLDFRPDADELEGVYFELLDTLHGRRQAPPPVGSPPFPARHRQEPAAWSDKRQRQTKDAVSGAYPIVLKKLLETGSDDPTVVQMGREWLIRSSQDEPGWTFVWNTLMNRDPNDGQLAEMGREWLFRSSLNDPAWTLVWNTLVNRDPDDRRLAEMGREWLRRQ